MASNLLKSDDIVAAVNVMNLTADTAGHIAAEVQCRIGHIFLSDAVRLSGAFDSTWLRIV